MATLAEALANYYAQQHNRLLSSPSPSSEPQLKNRLLKQPAPDPEMNRLAQALKPKTRSMSEDEVYFGSDPIGELRRTVNTQSYTPEQAAENRKASLWEALSVIPGPGNAIAAHDAYTGAGDAYNAFSAGEYKDGALASALAGLSGAGAVFGLPVGKFAKGAATSGKNTLFSGVGSPGSKAMTEEFDARNVILPHSHFDPKHLAKVKEEMQRLGSPEIRGIPIDDTFAAVEGSHRLRAAQELGVPVQLKSILDDDVVDLNAIGIDDMNWFDERVVPRQEFVDWYLQNWLPHDAKPLSVKVPR
jgi:hypothetical protein